MASEKKKKLLIIDSGEGDKTFIYDLIDTSLVELHFAFPKHGKWVNKYTSSKEQTIECDVYRAESVLQAVNNIDVHFDGIGTFYDPLVVQTATVAEELGLIQISVEAAKRSSANKFLTRTECNSKGVPMPKFLLVEDANENSLAKSINDFGFPCIVKPITGWKSYGVKKFTKPTNSTELKEVLQLSDEGEREMFRSFKNDFLIEEFMTGPVLSADGFIQNKKIHFAGIIEFEMGPEPYFTQEANYIPPRIAESIQDQCFTYATDVINALGFDNCGFHCELRLTPKGPLLIEIACRLPGGPLQLGYKQAYGHNLPMNLVDVWLGKKTKLKETPEKHIVQRAIYDYTAGHLESVVGAEKLSAHPQVWASAQLKKTGELIKTYPEVPEPIYFYALEAETAEDLQNLESEIEKQVEYSIE